MNGKFLGFFVFKPIAKKIIDFNFLKIKLMRLLQVQRIEFGTQLDFYITTNTKCVMRTQPYDNPFRTQLQLENQFKLAQEMKNEGAYSADEYHRLVGYLTRDFAKLQDIEPEVTMRWDFSSDPLGKVMMELTMETIRNQNIENLG